jgi:predicted nucleic acid-binding protein
LIYADTSVVLAHLLSESRRPPDTFWDGELVSSRLLEYEVWCRLHALGLAATHGELARHAVGSLLIVELTGPVLVRALEPFPAPVRTLDALHLASVDFLRRAGQDVELATYDARMEKAATALGVRCIRP